MLVVLEGVDGSGKTTLAEALVEEGKARGWDTELWHRGVPVRHPLEEYELDLENDYPTTAAGRMKTLVVADRWHLGQLVYGGLYRDSNDLGMHGAWHVTAMLEAFGAEMRLITAPLDVVKSRLATRGEDYLKEEHVERVWSHYNDLTSSIGPFPQFLGTDTNDAPTDVYVTEILRQVERKARDAAALTTQWQYIGPTRPRILVLGNDMAESDEAPGGRDVHLSPFMPYPGNTGSVYLAKSLAYLSSSLRVGLASVASRTDVTRLWTTLGCPQVVTIDHATAGAVRRVGIPFNRVPDWNDAAHVRPTDTDAYGDMIADAAQSKEDISWRS